MQYITITPTTKVEKGKNGIYIDGALSIIKDYLVYLIMYKDQLETKLEAQRVYENNSALFLVTKYLT